MVWFLPVLVLSGDTLQGGQIAVRAEGPGKVRREKIISHLELKSVTANS